MSTYNPQPGKVWHAWQNTKLFCKALFNAKERPKVSRAATGTGIAALGAAGLYAGIMVVSFPFNLIPLIAGGIALAGGGMKMSGGMSAIKTSSFGQAYKREQLQAWKDRKAQGPFLKRLGKAAAKTFFGVTKYGSVVAAAGSVAVLAAAGLALGGVDLGTTVKPLLDLVTIVSLPVTIGVAAAATAVSVVTAMGCQRQINVLNGKPASSKKTPAPKAPTSDLAWLEKAKSLPDVSPKGGFNGTASTPTETTATRRMTKRGNRL